ncbi:hypothetical protein BO85DRAFT_171535 [Aspergillus piperis CBS 112811]|uniref:Uncharacterized protein n=1 Tax=Aspergillus piperis CBS 112811 TaxID=1448313 RepID=A0A8G1VGY4_9EURO|nr:hypothetical protein BO85DRAFT_171535 [Aspergillus piperis CBS 112811]RAH52774.1 hypothetical protein BO85DRAFT_171535 [Aspergillus piperis CBS 112811]
MPDEPSDWAKEACSACRCMYLSGQAGLGRILIHKSYAFRLISSSHYYEKWIAIWTSHGSGSLTNTFSSFLWSLPLHPASAKDKYIIFHIHVNRAIDDTPSESREELFKPLPTPHFTPPSYRLRGGHKIRNSTWNGMDEPGRKGGRRNHPQRNIQLKLV